MKKKNFDYFESFVQMASYSKTAAGMLEAFLQDFKTSTLKEHMERLHTIEHAEDKIRHTITDQLVVDFITPIERDDIAYLASALDDVTDAIEDALQKIYMYNIKSIRHEALNFTRMIISCCEQLYLAMTEFKNFKKSDKLASHLIEINRIEEECDVLYMESVRSLFVAESLPQTDIMGWNAVFDCLEKVCDVCEDVCDIIGGVVMKNS